MSETAYTELEGFPIRWAYGQAMPMEEEKIASTQPKTWNVSQTASAQKANTNTSTAMDVYGSNQVGEIIKTPANAIRINQIQVYGLKVGTPPNPLNIEIRKVQPSTTEFTPYSPSGTLGNAFLSAKTNYFIRRLSLSLSSGDNTIITLSPQLPAGNNIIIASVNEVTSTSEILFSLKILRGDNTVVDSNLIAVKANNKTQVLIAVDYSASANQTYTLVINSNTAYSANLNIVFCVFQLANVSFGKTSTAVNVPNGSTIDLVSLTPGFSTGVNAIIGFVGCSNSNGATTVSILKDSTIVSSTEFNSGTPSSDHTRSIVLLYLDTSPSSTTQYKLQVYNNTGNSINCEGRLLVLNVPSGDFYDSPPINETTPVTKTFSTNIKSNTEALIIWVEQLSSASGFISVSASYRGWQTPAFRQYYWGFFVTIPIILPSRENNPIIELSLTGGTITYEYKVLAIPIRTIPTTLTKTVKVEIKFPAANIKYVTFRMKKVGLPPDQTIKAELFLDEIKIGETNITSSSLTMDYQSFTIYPSQNLLGGEAKLLITAIGDQINTIGLQTDSSTYQTWKKYYSDSEAFDGPPLALTVNSYHLQPTEYVLASGSIAASSVGTSAAWICINLSSPIVLRPNTYYAIIVYTIGGDGSNKYQLYKGGQVGDAFENLLTSSNSGGSWTVDTSTDLSFQVMGYQMTKIYSGTRDLVFTKAPASPILCIFIYAQTSSSMEFAAFDDYVLAASPVTSTSASQTKITVLSATDPRYRDPGSITQISWEIWAAGVGLSTKAGTQVYAYYNKTPVTPRDFGFSELYLIQARAVDANSVAIINDHFAGILYFQNSGDTFTPPSMFRVPVKKIHVMQGRVTFDLLGVV
jgi:hypothetical protein